MQSVWFILYKEAQFLLNFHALTIAHMKKKEKRKARQNKNPEGNLQPLRPVNSFQDLFHV